MRAPRCPRSSSAHPRARVWRFPVRGDRPSGPLRCRDRREARWRPTGHRRGRCRSPGRCSGRLRALRYPSRRRSRCWSLRDRGRDPIRHRSGRQPVLRRGRPSRAATRWRRRRRAATRGRRSRRVGHFGASVTSVGHPVAASSARGRSHGAGGGAGVVAGSARRSSSGVHVSVVSQSDVGSSPRDTGSAWSIPLPLGVSHPVGCQTDGPDASEGLEGSLVGLSQEAGQGEASGPADAGDSSVTDAFASQPVVEPPRKATSMGGASAALQPPAYDAAESTRTGSGTETNPVPCRPLPLL